MTMIQNIGLFGLNLLVGWANNFRHADASNPAGYRLGMWIFSILGILGSCSPFCCGSGSWDRMGTGLETITTGKSEA